ncbi:MAG: DUF4388 domain-containing protein [Nitrospirae bacterium]|nr:DUF4388 domain-containing protein [Nitrospirota bacterium]
MSKPKGILIFNRHHKFLSNLLKNEECPIFETANPLESLNILQKEDIGIVFASHDIEGIESSEFKILVEKIKPGVNTLFIAPFSEKDKDFSINTQDFLNLVHNYITTECKLSRELTELKNFSYSLADRLLQIFDVHDMYFFNNDHFVAELSFKIAFRMGLDESLAESIRMAALLRDLGMVGIERQILEGTQRLNQSELTPIKEHPIHTMQILRQVKFPWNLDSIISQHHERYDGKGYPMGLKAREISIGARILSITDAYYAMTTDRPYRKAISREKVIQEIVKHAGTQFDPEVVEVFLSVIKEEPSETAIKKNILIFERENNIAALIKLSATGNEMEIAHVTSSIDAMGYIRQKSPDLIIADVESLEPDAFVRFYNAVQKIRTAIPHRFLFITSDKDHISHFNGNVDYILKPLNLNKLTVKIKNLLFETPPTYPHEETRGLVGSLEEFTLTDIVQILSLGLKTAKVEITKGKENGTLYLLNGKIVYVSAGDLKGPEAFFELIRWEDGRFCIIHGETTNDINVTVDTMHLLLEATTVLDEKKSNKNQISAY